MIAGVTVTMNFLKHTILFIGNNLQQIKRKSYMLPLILLFPALLIGGVVILIMTFFDVSETSPIQLAVVNEDQSEETEMIVEVLEESSEFGPFMQVEVMEKAEAEASIEEDEISSYVLLPSDFTSKLYDGLAVTMSVIGNPEQQMESNVVHELINSVMRHIESSQANILLVNEYAQKVNMDEDTRSELIMDEFMRTFLSVAGKDKIISEDTVKNYSTTSPVDYFVLSSFFILLTAWLLVVYHFLYREEASRMKERMRLYGVTALQQVFARMIVTLLVTMIVGATAFYGIVSLIEFELYTEDIARIALICILYSIVYLLGLAIIEMIIQAPRIRLLIHTLFTLLFIVLSGALIPTIYFPLYIQEWLTYIPSYEALFWLQEILLNERLYADYQSLLLYGGSGIVILILLSIWKERVR